jgi:hypothetical protein
VIAYTGPPSPSEIAYPRDTAPAIEVILPNTASTISQVAYIPFYLTCNANNTESHAA